MLSATKKISCIAALSIFVLLPSCLPKNNASAKAQREWVENLCGSGTPTSAASSACNDAGNVVKIVPNGSTRSFRSFSMGDDKNMILQISSIGFDLQGKDSVKVRVHVQAYDKDGNFISDLDRKNWCVLDDDSQTKHEVGPADVISTEIDGGSGPLDVALIMDHSGSMGDARVCDVQQATFLMLEQSVIDGKGDHFSIFPFSADVRNVANPLDGVSKQTLKDNAARQALLMQFCNECGPSGGTTALYDAIGIGLDSLDALGDENIKHIIAFTDGMDTNSDPQNLPSKLAGIAFQRGIAINTIAFGQNAPESILRNDLSRASGGSFYRLCRSDGFRVMFDDLKNRWRNSYVIEYVTRKTNSVHRVTVTLCDEDVKKQTGDFPAARQTFIPEKPMEVIPVQFKTASYALPGPDSLRATNTDAVERVCAMLRDDKSTIVALVGHTDSVGEEESNLTLSLNRANAVKNEVVKKLGIAPERIWTFGYGEEFPIADNESETGRALNRRVEVTLNPLHKEFYVERQNAVFLAPHETSL